MPIKNTVVQDAIQFTAADRRKHIEAALTGVSGSLVEVRDNIYFIILHTAPALLTQSFQLTSKYTHSFSALYCK